jgi:hypothetical protein
VHGVATTAVCSVDPGKLFPGPHSLRTRFFCSCLCLPEFQFQRQSSSTWKHQAPLHLPSRRACDINRTLNDFFEISLHSLQHHYSPLNFSPGTKSKPKNHSPYLHRSSFLAYSLLHFFFGGRSLALVTLLPVSASLSTTPPPSSRYHTQYLFHIQIQRSLQELISGDYSPLNFFPHLPNLSSIPPPNRNVILLPSHLVELVFRHSSNRYIYQYRYIPLWLFGDLTYLWRIHWQEYKEI